MKTKGSHSGPCRGNGARRPGTRLQPAGRDLPAGALRLMPGTNLRGPAHHSIPVQGLKSATEPAGGGGLGRGSLAPRLAPGLPLVFIDKVLFVNWPPPIHVALAAAGFGLQQSRAVARDVGVRADSVHEPALCREPVACDWL